MCTSEWGDWIRLLGRLDPNEKIYLSRSGVRKKQDIQRLQLRSHEHYCMGGPGVVLSGATLNAVAPYLDRCLEVVEAHNRIKKSVAGEVCLTKTWSSADVLVEVSVYNVLIQKR